MESLAFKWALALLICFPLGWAATTCRLNPKDGLVMRLESLDPAGSLLTSSGVVLAWLDKSGYANDLNVNPASTRLGPLVVTSPSLLSGTSAVSFNKKNSDILLRTSTLKSFPLGNQDRTVAVLVSYGGGVGGVSFGPSTVKACPNEFRVTSVGFTQQQSGESWSDGCWSQTSGGSVGTGWRRLVMTLKSGMAATFRDNVLMANVTIASQLQFASTADMFVIGGTQDLTNRANLLVAAVFVWNRALTWPELQEVDSYLVTQYLDQSASPCDACQNGTLVCPDNSQCTRFGAQLSEVRCQCEYPYVANVSRCLAPCAPSSLIGTNGIEIGGCDPSFSMSGDNCTLRCTSGYLQVGSLDLRCTDGKWSTLQGQCTNYCPNPPSFPNNSQITIGNCTRVPLGQSCSLGCSSATQSTTSMVIRCLQTGVFTEFTGTCLAGCGVPPVLSSTTTINIGNCSDNSVSGSTCSLGCDDNWLASGDMSISCDDGEWSPFTGTCKAPCSSLPLEVGSSGVQSGSCQVPSLSGSHCSLQCLPDWKPDGDMSVSCNTGRWSSLPGSCQAPCAGLPPAVDGKLLTASGCNVNLTQSQSSCSLECGLGAAAVGDMTVNCFNGKWSTWEGECLAPCSGADLMASLSSSAIQLGSCLSSTPSGTTCKLGCKQGWLPSDTLSSTCQNGNWLGTQGSCLAPCLQPTFEVFGAPVTTCNETTPSGSSCSIPCPSMVPTSDAITLRCQDGQWSSSGKCSGLCTLPPLKEPLTTGNCTTYTGSGFSCSLECLPNYEPIGNMTLQCNQGQWVQSLPACSGPCVTNVLPSPDFAFGNCNKTVKDGARCKWDCSLGFTAIGDLRSRCENGSLSFPNATCIPEVPQLQTCVLPCASYLRGGANITITGTFFRSTGILIDGKPVKMLFSNDSAIVFSSIRSTRWGYLNLTVYNTAKPDIIQSEKWIYYQADSNISCIGVGQYFDGQSCTTCPGGSFCPGGDRVWPMAGFWSPNERTLPVQCKFADACPGVEQLSAGEKDTEVCSPTGYTGDFCSQCKVGYYQAFISQCVSCNLTTAAGTYGSLIAAIIVFALIAVGSVCLKITSIPAFVVALVSVQQLLVVSNIAALKIKNLGFTETLNNLSFLNFNVGWMRPGCNSLAPIEWVGLFWASLAMMLCTAVIPIAVYLSLKWRQGRGTTQGTNMEVRKRGRVLTIVFVTMMYLQLCVRSFQGILCKEVTSHLRLVVQPSTICFEGAHTIVAVVIFICLLPFIVGVPLFLAAFVLRGQRCFEAIKTRLPFELLSSEHRVNFKEFPWVSLLILTSSLLLALGTSLEMNTARKLFLAALTFLASSSTVAAIWTFRHLNRGLFDPEVDNENAGFLFISPFSLAIITTIYLGFFSRLYFSIALVLLGLIPSCVVLAFLDNRYCYKVPIKTKETQSTELLKSAQAKEPVDAPVLSPLQLNNESPLLPPSGPSTDQPRSSQESTNSHESKSGDVDLTALAEATERLRQVQSATTYDKQQQQYEEQPPQYEEQPPQFEEQPQYDEQQPQYDEQQYDEQQYDEQQYDQQYDQQYGQQYGSELPVSTDSPLRSPISPDSPATGNSEPSLPITVEANTPTIPQSYVRHSRQSSYNNLSSIPPPLPFEMRVTPFKRKKSVEFKRGASMNLGVLGLIPATEEGEEKLLVCSPSRTNSPEVISTGLKPPGMPPLEIAPLPLSPSLGVHRPVHGATPTPPNNWDPVSTPSAPQAHLNLPESSHASLGQSEDIQAL